MEAGGNLFGKSLLTDYGKCLSVYNGKGVLTLEDGKQYDFQFEAGQLASGQVLLVCDFLPPPMFFINILPKKFEGITPEGYRIYANSGMFHRSSGVWAAFYLEEMLVQMAEYQQTNHLRFGITNFEFIGTEPIRRSDNYFYRTLPLNLQNDNQATKVLIEPLELYGKIMKRVQILKNIEVTCEAIVDTITDGDIPRVTEVVDDLCYILSVARGTKIQWVYCDQYNVEGKLIKRTHSSRITKPYCPLKIIHPSAGGGKETKAFVEQAYPAYVNKRKPYKLDKGTIDAYLDAKAEADFLEMRGVKFAVSMEILKKVFCKSMNIKGGSFKSLIENLCNSINLNVSKQEIDLFVKSRNSLIHGGEFFCIAATPKQRERFKVHSTQTEEYLFLVNFLDRVFLKLLGYSGPYIDWRIPDNPTRQEQV